MCVCVCVCGGRGRSEEGAVVHGYATAVMRPKRHHLLENLEIRIV